MPFNEGRQKGGPRTGKQSFDFAEKQLSPKSRKQLKAVNSQRGPQFHKNAIKYKMTSNSIKIFRWRIDSCIYACINNWVPNTICYPVNFLTNSVPLLVKFQCKTKQFDNFGVLSTKYTISVYCVPNTLKLPGILHTKTGGDTLNN